MLMYHFILEEERYACFPRGQPGDDATVLDGIVYISGYTLYALDARTGTKLWKQQPPELGPYFGRPHIINGVVFFETNAGMTIRVNPPSYYRVYAFDPKTGKQLWRSSPGYWFFNEVVDGGKVVLLQTIPIQTSPATKNQDIQAVDAKSGTLRWRISFARAPCPSTSWLCPISQLRTTGSQLYVLDGLSPRTLRVFDLDNGKQLAQHPISIPDKEDIRLDALGNGLLYITSSMHEGELYYSGSDKSFQHYFIYAIRVTDGTTAWKYDIGALVEVQVPITGLQLTPS